MSTTMDELLAENERLRQQVSEMETLRTENQQLRQQLSEERINHQWMKLLLEQSTIPTCFWEGSDFVYRFANERYLVGSGKLDAVGKPICDVFEEHEIPGLLPTLEYAYSSGEVQIVPEAVVRLQNPETGEIQEMWLTLFYSPVRDDHGVVIGVSHFAIDITQQVIAQQESRVFQTMIENAPDGIGITDADANITYANGAMSEIYGYGDAVIGVNAASLYAPEDQAKIPSIVAALETQGFWKGIVNHQRENGEVFPALVSFLSLQESGDKSRSLAAIVRDISEQQHAEQERATLQEQVIAAQREALRELSAPLLPISDHVVVLPLVGSIDSQRAQQVMETLLEGIARYQSDVAIVDITGVQVVDTQVANALIQTAQAVSLLGAKVILTGIGPTMAQTLIHMGADLSSIVTRGSLQSGIAYAMES